MRVTSNVRSYCSAPIASFLRLLRCAPCLISAAAVMRPSPHVCDCCGAPRAPFLHSILIAVVRRSHHVRSCCVASYVCADAVHVCTCEEFFCYVFCVQALCKCKYILSYFCDAPRASFPQLLRCARRLMSAAAAVRPSPHVRSCCGAVCVCMRVCVQVLCVCMYIYVCMRVCAGAVHVY